MKMKGVKQLEVHDGPSDSQLDGVLELQATDEEYAKLLRKLDLVLMPLMGVCYMFQLLDKMALNISTQLGLLEDLDFRGSEYSWVSSIFYFGYFVWTWPIFWLAVRLPLGKYIGVSVFLWGAVLMCHGACANFAGFMAARFFLGAAEATVAPGFSLIVAMFYKRKEQPLRQGLWFAGNCFANIVGGLVGYGIGNIESSLATWRILFLILGGVTVAYSALLAFFLPDSPSKARFLNEREKNLALHRMLENRASILDEDSFIPHQMWEALKDPQAWLLALYSFSINICNGGISTFVGLLVRGFGFGPFETLLLQMPIGGLQLVALGTVSILATITRIYRTALMVVVCATSLTGMVLVISLSHENPNGRLVGIYLASTFAANIPMALSLVASNVGGFTKRATVNTMVFVGYSAGNIIGPQFYLTSQAPIYQIGVHANIACFSISIVFLLSLMLYYKLENRSRDRKFILSSGVSTEESREDAYIGETDMSNYRFRYIL